MEYLSAFTTHILPALNLIGLFYIGYLQNRRIKHLESHYDTVDKIGNIHKSIDHEAYININATLMAKSKYDKIMEERLPEVAKQVADEVADSFERGFEERAQPLFDEHREFTVFCSELWEGMDPKIREDFFKRHLPTNHNWLFEMFEDIGSKSKED